MLPKEYDTAFDRELAGRLRITRKTLGLSERDAAAAAGVTIKTYRKWEAGGHAQSSVTLTRLCHELEVSVTWMVSGEGRFLARDSYERRSAQPLLSDAGVYVKAVRH